ncbi:hypothetical protein Cs7R123_06530 [Catellatospora sp. TT07R-123]|uniref:hypothetical protein n=1 Tax=Catellatospora sp. TT07R-123 TaxID=2733863 RepID=UPI001AFF6B15|nr:hypothetical protein [Catellatospora sp. TT07R-123]GHJ43311.1 hypothetical protein Cs7R123_06530 [Catellatospora sp. TT07R-123]
MDAFPAVDSACARFRIAAASGDTVAAKAAADEVATSILGCAPEHLDTASEAVAQVLGDAPAAAGGSLALAIAQTVPLRITKMLLPVVESRTVALLEDATRFNDLYRDLVGELPWPMWWPDHAAVIEEFTAAAAAAGWEPQSARSWAKACFECSDWLDVLYYLVQDRRLRPQLRDRVRLVAAAARVGDSIWGVAHLEAVLLVLDDEPLVVLHRETGTAFRITINGVPYNSELDIVLAKAINELTPADAGTPPVLGGATQFDLTDAHGDWLLHSRPVDIPELDGTRVVVLDPLPASRHWTPSDMFPHLQRHARAVALAPEEAAAWHARIAPAGARHRDLLPGPHGPWAVVDEPTALAAAGPTTQVMRAGATTFGLGRAATVVVIEPGAFTHATGLLNRDTIVVHEQLPRPVAHALIGNSAALPALGFVRLPEGCLSLGRIRVSTGKYHPTSQDKHERPTPEYLTLAVPLPYQTLDRVRPTPAVYDSPDLGWMDLLPADPIGALKRFTEGWFADIPPQPSPTPPSTDPIPNALAEFHRIVAGRHDAFTNYIRAIPREQLKTLGRGPFAGWLKIGLECDGGWEILTHPEPDDPLIVLHDFTDRPIFENERLSGFLLQWVLAETTWYSAPYRGEATVTREQARQFANRLRRVPLRPMRYPGDPTYLYAAPGVIATIGTPYQHPHDAGTPPDPDIWEVSIGARTPWPLQPFREPGFTWDNFNA